MARKSKFEEEKNRLDSVREYLVGELKWHQDLEESAARDKDYGKAGHYSNDCIMIEKAIKLCGEEKSKEGKKENE